MTPDPHAWRLELPPAIKGLIELALDMRWSWNHTSDLLWRTIDADLWDKTANPLLILQTISRRRVRELAADPDFVAELERQLDARARSLKAPAWFDAQPDTSDLGRVAYFSMEFGLSDALPIYSGGLGVLAGDTLKTASDLGVPMIGIGLLYQQGYFRQIIDNTGHQLAYYPYNNPAMLPISPLRDAEGEWLNVNVEFPGRELCLRCWEVVAGRVRLLLLDSNDPSNDARDRGVTGALYGGNDETRLQQEIALGVGGWRMLGKLDLRPTVCHLNEGHAALVVLERAAELMRAHALDFPTALRASRAGNLFTTHTPVAAAFDRFSPPLMRQYLTPLAARWGVEVDTLLALGRVQPDNATEPFNMAWLALRGSGAVNGVSRLHGHVSRALFAPLFPRWPLAEIPVGHVTNGVHTPSWDSTEADALWTQHCGRTRWSGNLTDVEQKIMTLDDEALWEFRAAQRRRLVDAVRRRRTRQAAVHGEAAEHSAAFNRLIDPNILTLGFARRFTAYKRNNLLLHQPERLLRLLADPQRPVQLLLAGMAHPQDAEGQEMIREWVEFIARADLPPGRVAFVEDYDMTVAGDLVQGVDVWINTPRRPWEASGTSGMKVLVNGGLNLSELDGWWAEAYTPEVGWALGDGHDHGVDPDWDAAEAEALYRLLESEVIPEFYDRDAGGLPRRWIARVRHSIARLTPMYSTNRMLREYVLGYYLPGARSLAARLAENGAPARRLEERIQRLRAHWPALRFGVRSIVAVDGALAVEAQVFLDDLDPEDVDVQLYADPPASDAPPERHSLKLAHALTGATGGYHYTARIATSREAGHYTLRVVPRLELADAPLEVDCILWAE
jgi:starch phosphorylase